MGVLSDNNGSKLNGSKPFIMLFLGMISAVAIPALLGFFWLGRLQTMTENNFGEINRMRSDVNQLQNTLGIVQSRQDDVRERLADLERQTRAHEAADSERFRQLYRPSDQELLPRPHK